MPFQIRMGVPQMEAHWNDFSGRKLAGTLDRDQQKYFKKLVKALGHLAANPRHPGATRFGVTAGNTNSQPVSLPSTER